MIPVKDKSKIKIKLPPKVEEVLGTIMAAGYEAYAVGGCIRDSLLERKPGDWDITTSATPQQVKALFKRTIDTGIQHGTVTVMLEKEGFEVTTYRIDGKYEDGRHPTEVTFTPSLTEDLKRRDFTMNAMAYNEKTGLVDLFGGIEDMEKGVIRCVGDAMQRFKEDALRMMRAIRFSAQLGYEIEENTFLAIRALAGDLEKISAERIQVELTKLAVSAYPGKLRIAYETGVLSVILPEFAKAMETPQNHPYHCYNVGEHILRAMENSPRDKNIRLALLFHDIGKPECCTTDEQGINHFHGHAQVGAEMTRKILKRLRFDNDTIQVVTRLVLYHDYGNGVKPDKRIVRRAMHKIGPELFPALFEVKHGDTLAQSRNFQEESLKNLEEWEQVYREVLAAGECVSLKTLALTGSDLIALGMKPGKQLGDTLQELLKLVIENPEYNTAECLKEIVRERFLNQSS